MRISIFTNGWNWRNATVKRALVTIMLICGMNLYAQNSNPPDMALLEFLGEGVKVENEVVDPITWQAIEDMTGANQTQQGKTQQKQDGAQQQSRRQNHD